MKRLLLLILIFALLLLPMGCVDVQSITNSMLADMMEKVGANFTIEVGGTVGLNFTGEYEVWYLHFDPGTQSIVYTKDSYTVEGQVPEQYTFEGAATAVMFQKQAGDSWRQLEVKIWQDDELVAQRETTDPWGAVWVNGAILYE
jgi:hypothetical protein